MKVALITLGCPKNLVDAEVMLGLIDAAGHTLTADPRSADAVVVNTCAFVSAAVDEARRVIEDTVRLRRGALGPRLVVAGCLPQRYGELTMSMFPGVDAVVGCSRFFDIVLALADAADGRPSCRVSTPVAQYDHRSPRILGTPRHLAYVKIAEGCDNRCAYCTVPSIRGALRSRDPESVVAETESLLKLGVREVNLIAQDTTAYGTDIASGVRLPALVRRLSALGVPWIRIMYAHPAHLSDELLSAMRDLACVVPYIDLPVQHVSDRILRAMGRGMDGADVTAALDRARRAVPGITVRSSAIVGFPGETEAEFGELLRFVEEGHVDLLAVFEFSPEPGTVAAGMPGQVPAAAASARARALSDAMARVAAARSAAAIGTELTVLVDEGGERPRGRTPGQAWEIDGSVALEGGSHEPGQFVRARITGARDYDLEAVVVSSESPGGRRGAVARGRARRDRPEGETS